MNNKGENENLIMDNIIRGRSTRNKLTQHVLDKVSLSHAKTLDCKLPAIRISKERPSKKQASLCQPQLKFSTLHQPHQVSSHQRPKGASGARLSHQTSTTRAEVFLGPKPQPMQWMASWIYIIL
jgi:hypothetical protein